MKEFFYEKSGKLDNGFPIWEYKGYKEENEVKDKSYSKSYEVWKDIKTFLTDYLKIKKNDVFLVRKSDGKIISIKTILNLFLEDNYEPRVNGIFTDLVDKEKYFFCINNAEDVLFLLGETCLSDGKVFYYYEGEDEDYWVSVKEEIAAFKRKWLPKNIPGFCDYIATLIEKEMERD